MTWIDIIDNFTQKEENCLISLLSNGHNNCFTRKTFYETIKEGYSLKNIHSVLKKLEQKKLCHKLPQNIFSIMWGWLYEPEFSVIMAWGMYVNGRSL